MNSLRIEQQVEDSKTPNPEAGQGLVEYAMILSLVAVVVLLVLALLGPAIQKQYILVKSSLDCANYMPEIDAANDELMVSAQALYSDDSIPARCLAVERTQYNELELSQARSDLSGTLPAWARELGP